MNKNKSPHFVVLLYEIWDLTHSLCLQGSRTTSHGVMLRGSDESSTSDASNCSSNAIFMLGK